MDTLSTERKRLYEQYEMALCRHREAVKNQALAEAEFWEADRLLSKAEQELDQDILDSTEVRMPSAYA